MNSLQMNCEIAHHKEVSGQLADVSAGELARTTESGGWSIVAHYTGTQKDYGAEPYACVRYVVMRHALASTRAAERVAQDLRAKLTAATARAEHQRIAAEMWESKFHALLRERAS